MVKKIGLSFIAWFVLLIVAIINGGIRNSFYSEPLGELHAHQLSALIFIIMIFLVTWLYLVLFKKIKYTKKDLLWIGAIWVVATIIFEFVFGHYVMNHSWQKLFADYNIFTGRVWSLVILFEIFVPYLAGLLVYKKREK